MDGSASKRAISRRASMAILSAFSSMRRALAGQRRAVERPVRLLLGDEPRDRRGDLARQARLAHDDGEQRAVDPLQMPHEIGLDAVAREADRAALQQRFRRDAQHRS